MVALGIGLICVSVIGGIGMFKYGGAMEDRGKHKIREAIHASEVKKDIVRSEAIMDYQIQKTVNKIEQEELEEDGASEKEISKKALERWGKH